MKKVKNGKVSVIKLSDRIGFKTVLKLKEEKFSKEVPADIIKYDTMFKDYLKVRFPKIVIKANPKLDRCYEYDSIFQQAISDDECWKSSRDFKPSELGVSSCLGVTQSFYDKMMDKAYWDRKDDDVKRRIAAKKKELAEYDYNEDQRNYIRYATYMSEASSVFVLNECSMDINYIDE